ncbi:MAG TPA: metalloregulator ArsR/SmtB family transcription factor [Chloroflexota bacterium]|jgi:ArsR family transcriptional regulator
METQLAPRPLPIRQRGEPCCAPPGAPKLPVARAERLAEHLKALADPTRLRILDLLSQQEEPLCVCDITPRFAQNQPTISHHLRLLRQAGLIACHKQGIWAFYHATASGRRSLETINTLP